MRYIIFDLDGTLARSGDYEAVFIETCARLDIAEEKARTFWHNNQGLPLKQQFAKISGADRATVKEMANYFWASVGDAPFVAIDGANELLARLRGEGRLLFLTTGSTPARLNQCLDELGWGEYFHLAQGSDETNSKGPEHYKKMAASVQEPLAPFAKTAAIVGDGAYDMYSARQAGVEMRIGYLPPDGPAGQEDVLRTSGADIIIDSLRQLPDIFETS